MQKLRPLYSSTRAAIDLASIMVGIIIIGIIGGIIAATIFAVIPWSQDRAAKATLDAANQAESAYSGFAADPDSGSSKTPNYGTLNQLNTKGLYKADDSLNIGVGTDGTCYTATAVSKSGKIFWYDSNKKSIQQYTYGTSTANCSGLNLDALVPASAIPAATITPTSVNVTAANYTPYAMGQSADGKYIWVGGSSTSAAYYSADSGATWKAFTISSLGIGSVRAINVSADGQTVLFSGDSNSTAIKLNAAGTSYTAFYTTTSAASKAGAILDDGSKFYGVTTSSPTLYSKTPDSFSAKTVSSFSVSATKLLVNVDGTKFMYTQASGQGSVYVSTNSGSTFNAASISIQSSAGLSQSADHSKVVAVNGKSLYYTENWGTSWSTIPLPNTGSTYNDGYKGVTVSNDGQRIVAAQLSGNVQVSTDGGKSWKSVDTGLTSVYGLTITGNGLTFDMVGAPTTNSYGTQFYKGTFSH